MDVTIRQFHHDELPSIARMYEQLVQCLIPLNPQRRKQPLPGLAKWYQAKVNEITTNGGTIFVAQINNHLVGYALGSVVPSPEDEGGHLAFEPSTEGEIVDIYVEEQYRRQGVGKKLILELESYFRKQGCTHMVVEVLVENELAVNVYRNAGYNPREMYVTKKL